MTFSRLIQVGTTVAVLIVGFSAGNSLAGQSRPPANVERLNAKSQVYLALAKDLLQMVGPPTTRNLDEFQLGSALSDSAKTASEYFSAATDLLIVYDLVQTAADKGRIRSYINKRLDDYSQQLETQIKLVNIHLSTAANAGIAATGVHLRDELRDGQMLLKSVELR